MDNGHNRHLWWNQPAVEWSLIGLGWLLLLTLGVIGFLRHAALHHQSIAVLDALYLTIQLVSMNSGEVSPPLPWELNVARFGIPALVALSAVRAFALIFRRQA